MRIKFAVTALAAVAIVLLPMSAAQAQQKPPALLSGFMFCSGDVPSPGAWIDGDFGRIRVCIDIPTHVVEGDVQDTRTDGFCVEAKYNEFATTTQAFMSFPASRPLMFGSATSCGAVTHFLTVAPDNTSDGYESLWKIRLYRSTAFKLALDTHTARLVMR